MQLCKNKGMYDVRSQLGAVHKLRHHLWGEGGVRQKMTL